MFNDKTKKILLIGGIIAIISIILFAMYSHTNKIQEAKLTVLINGQPTKDGLSIAGVATDLFGIGDPGAGYVYTVAPEQELLIGIVIYNDYDDATRTFKAVMRDGNGNTIWSSGEVIINKYAEKEWYIFHNAPTKEGLSTLTIESGVINLAGTAWLIDDSDTIKINVVSTDPCAGITCPDKCVGNVFYYYGSCSSGVCSYTKKQIDGKCGYTTPPPDPCAGITCPDKCVAPYTLKTDGLCSEGTCAYRDVTNSPECGYVQPTPTASPTGTPTLTPTGTGTLPPGGEDEGISSELLWGGAIIGGAIIFALYMITRPVGKKKK